MKSINKNRIQKLEKFIRSKEKKSKFAMIVYDPSISIFEISALNIKTDIVFAMPDNGRRLIGNNILEGPYKITYG